MFLDEGNMSVGGFKDKIPRTQRIILFSVDFALVLEVKMIGLNSICKKGFCKST